MIICEVISSDDFCYLPQLDRSNERGEWMKNTSKTFTADRSLCCRLSRNCCGAARACLRASVCVCVCVLGMLWWWSCTRTLACARTQSTLARVSRSLNFPSVACVRNGARATSSVCACVCVRVRVPTFAWRVLLALSAVAFRFLQILSEHMCVCVAYAYAEVSVWVRVCCEYESEQYLAQTSSVGIQCCVASVGWEYLDQCFVCVFVWAR